jgi:hypothetical protein
MLAALPSAVDITLGGMGSTPRLLGLRIKSQRWTGASIGREKT